MARVWGIYKKGAEGIYEKPSVSMTAFSVFTVMFCCGFLEEHFRDTHFVSKGFETCEFCDLFCIINDAVLGALTVLSIFFWTPTVDPLI